MTYPTQQIPGINPQNIVLPTPVGLQSAGRDPTAQDNTYVPGSEWQNTSSGTFFKCKSSGIAGAVWVPFVPSAAGTVSTLTGDSGGAVGPDGGGNINVVGDGTTIDIVGNPGTNTLTVSVIGGGATPASSFVTNVSGPVSPSGAGVIDLNASTTTYTDGSVANTINIELQGLSNHIFVGAGALTPAGTIAPGNDGVLISSNAGIPSWLANSGTPGYALIANTSAPPSWQTVSAAVVAGVTSGASPASGFIGEQIRSAVSPVSVMNATPTNLTSITVSAGVWDISGVGTYVTNPLANVQTQIVLGVTTTSLFVTGNGDNIIVEQDGGSAYVSLTVPAWRLDVSIPTIVYLTGYSTFPSGAVDFAGRISATRVG